MPRQLAVLAVTLASATALIRVFGVELLRDEQARVVQGRYDSLAHTTHTSGGFETGVRPSARRTVEDNLAPHGWFAADLVTPIRNMLVRERDDGLELLSAVPGRGLEPGRATVVRARRRGSAPSTCRCVQSAADGADVEHRGGSRRRVAVGGAYPRRATCARRASRRTKALLLPGRAGRLRIHRRLPRRSSPFDGVAAAPQEAYRERKLSPPG